MPRCACLLSIAKGVTEPAKPPRNGQPTESRMSLFRRIVGKSFAVLVGVSVTLAFASAAQAVIDREAVAYLPGTPRLNTPFQLNFGFYNHGTTNARNVRVTNTIPTPFLLVSNAIFPGNGIICTNYGRQIVCTFPSTLPESFAGDHGRSGWAPAPPPRS